MTLPIYEESGADFDPMREYRYALWRRWGSGSTVCWVMLNPSTADETQLDPTLRRCADYTRRWGHSAMTVVNLYAWRSTDPKMLKQVDDPVGPLNDPAIAKHAALADVVVLGWGRNAEPSRAAAVFRFLETERPVCLHYTAEGHPGHPLYLPKTRMPKLYEPGGVVLQALRDQGYR
jgi:hypothetical protein